MHSTVEARKSGMLKIELCQISLPSARGISGYEITFQCDANIHDFFSFCLFPFLFYWANRVRKLKVHYNRTQVSSIFQNIQLAITIWRHILNL